MNKYSLVTFSLLGVLSFSASPGIAQSAFDELDAAVSGSTATGKKAEAEKTAFEQYKRELAGDYKDYKDQLQEEFQVYKQIAQQEFERHKKAVAEVWDKPELSSKKVWVEYSGDLKTKNRVDFEKKTISISTTEDTGKKVSNKELREKLKRLLVKNKAQAFRDDQVAQAIETKSKQQITLLETAKVKPVPILLPLVTDQKKPDEKQVNKLVDKLMEKKKKVVTTNKQGKKVVTIDIPYEPKKESLSDTRSEKKTARVMADLRVNKLPRAARQMASEVEVYARRSRVDEPLVYAVIETESAFNPMAKSPVPAYGLMQIVPSSAGLDATQQLFGKGRILSPSYLYTQDKNIEVGTTYLNILYYRYLKNIENPLSRLYCTIAAYNTGAGNVAKAFTGDRKLRKAIPKINTMTPQQVYDYLIVNLPYEETRNYLKKVVARMPKYSV